MIWTFLVLTMSFAKEQWLCTSQSSQMQGDTVMACGVGEGDDESTARDRALKHAQNEFNQICLNSCKQKTYSMEPMRTTCDKENGSWKCYRLLVYSPAEPQKLDFTKKHPYPKYPHLKAWYHNDGTPYEEWEIDEANKRHQALMKRMNYGFEVTSSNPSAD